MHDKLQKEGIKSLIGDSMPFLYILESPVKADLLCQPLLISDPMEGWQNNGEKEKDEEQERYHKQGSPLKKRKKNTSDPW